MRLLVMYEVHAQASTMHGTLYLYFPSPRVQKVLSSFSLFLPLEEASVFFNIVSKPLTFWIFLTVRRHDKSGFIITAIFILIVFSLLSLCWRRKKYAYENTMLSVNPSPEPVFMKLGMYVMAPEPISTAYVINPSQQSVCLYVYLLSLLGNDSVGMLTRQQIHTQNLNFSEITPFSASTSLIQYSSFYEKSEWRIVTFDRLILYSVPYIWRPGWTNGGTPFSSTVRIELMNHFTSIRNRAEALRDFNCTFL
jgi:hypothetical protein